MDSDIFRNIEKELGVKFISKRSVSGGCIANSVIGITEDNISYFVKTYSGAPGMFLKEANGLKELSKANSIRVPNVIFVDSDCLVLEAINEKGKSSDFFSEFGKNLARMHKFTNSSFGFFEDNYIGSNPQYNIAEGSEKTDWAKFYFNKRIKAQLSIAELTNSATNELKDKIFELEENISDILSDSYEEPSLLHGDLWGGNYISDENGQAVIIDPAVYYGHREADLAMTKMFGGFTNEFYSAYNNEYPLKNGWKKREAIYLLYHYLNHYNLFGSSYYSMCIRLLDRLNFNKNY